MRDKFRGEVISYFYAGVILIIGYLMAVVTAFPIAYQLGKYGKIVQILVVSLPTIFIIIGYIMKKSEEIKKTEREVSYFTVFLLYLSN